MRLVLHFQILNPNIFEVIQLRSDMKIVSVLHEMNQIISIGIAKILQQKNSLEIVHRQFLIYVFSTSIPWNAFQTCIYAESSSHQWNDSWFDDRFIWTVHENMSHFSL